MPFVDQSPRRRTLGPALATAVLGALAGALFSFGIAHFAVESTIPDNHHTISADDALLGGVEYGSRD